MRIYEPQVAKGAAAVSTLRAVAVSRQVLSRSAVGPQNSLAATADRALRR